MRLRRRREMEGRSKDYSYLAAKVGRYFVGFIFLIIIASMTVTGFVTGGSKSLELVELSFGFKQPTINLRLPRAYLVSNEPPDPIFGIELHMAWPDLRPWTLRGRRFVDPLTGQQFEPIIRKERGRVRLTISQFHQVRSRISEYAIDTERPDRYANTGYKFDKLELYLVDRSKIPEWDKGQSYYRSDVFILRDESQNFKAVIDCHHAVYGNIPPQCTAYWDIEGGGLKYHFPRDLLPSWEILDRRLKRRLAEFRTN